MLMTPATKETKVESLQQKKNYTALITIDGIGPKLFFQLIKYLKQNRISWDEFWVHYESVLIKMQLPQKIAESIKNFTKEYTIESYWQTLMQKSLSVVSFNEKNYPFLLKQIDDFPPILFVKGDIKLCRTLPVAIVGTRQMTAYGRLVTSKITQELVEFGATIISGFMYGVDVQAQQAALQADGQTVGVLGYGFDHIFPSQHQYLMFEMLKTGRAVFISEYPPHVEPTRSTFPRRNRIIAALSLAVVVTEAGLKSGTHITVGYALDYGRDVFAVSGPITSPYHEGVKQMLNQGATLVGNGQEVINNLSARNWGKSGQKLQTKIKEVQPSKQQLDLSELNLSPLQQQIMQTLQSITVSSQELGQQLGVDAMKLNSALIQLELQGLARCEANQWYVIGL